MKFPVVYFVDPRFASDPDTKGYSNLILSYTFFPAPDPIGARPLADAAAQGYSDRYRTFPLSSSARTSNTPTWPTKASSTTITWSTPAPGR